MSAGISLMYKISGGMKYNSICADCAYLKMDSESRGFGRKSSRDTYRCGKHPDKEEEHLWKPDLMACKLFREAKVKNIFTEDTNGQLSFL